MAAFVQASDIAAFVNTVYQDALLVAREQNLMAGLVTGFNDRSGTAIRSLQTYGTATLNSIGDADDLTSQAFTPSVLSTLTPGEVGAQFFLTDLRMETDPFNVRNDAAMELGQAMAEKIDRDLLGTFSSLTGGTVGAAGSAFSWGYFYAMLSRLKAQKAPMPYALVCHPYQWHALGKAASVAGSQTNASVQLLDNVNKNFYVGTVSGVAIYVTSNLAIDGSDDAKPAMFSAPALALDIRRAPRIEPERDTSRRGWELNLSAVYAYGVWRKTFGVQGIFDCTAPTS